MPRVWRVERNRCTPVSGKFFFNSNSLIFLHLTRWKSSIFRSLNLEYSDICIFWSSLEENEVLIFNNSSLIKIPRPGNTFQILKTVLSSNGKEELSKGYKCNASHGWSLLNGFVTFSQEAITFTDAHFSSHTNYRLPFLTSHGV